MDPAEFYRPELQPEVSQTFTQATPNSRGVSGVVKKTLKIYYGTGVDVHSLIGKLPALKKGWTFPATTTSARTAPLTNNLNTVLRR